MTERLSVVYVMVQNLDLDLIERARAEFSSEHGVDIELSTFFTYEADRDPLVFNEMAEKTREADFVMIRNLFVPKRFERLEKFEKILKETGVQTFVHAPNPEINDIFRHYFRGTDQENALFNLLMTNVTYENEIEVFKVITNNMGLTNIQVVLPEESAVDGIYEPGKGRVEDSEAFLDGLDKNRPTAGILFRTYIFDNYTMEHLDCLIGKLEDQGMQVLPVFFPAKSRKSKGEENSENVIRRYFMDGDRSRVDIILVMSPFSLIVNSVDEPGITSDPEVNFLRKLTNVPVVQALTVGAEWMDFADMKAGLGSKDVASFVAWPEIDGQIIGVPYACSKGDGGKANRMYPIPERAEHLSRMAYNWAKLGRKNPSERKVALLVYQKVFDNGRLGAASGLDSMESIVRILERLKSEGYDTGDIPENGRELLDMILSGVTNDFSNLSDEFILEKAGGTLDPAEYADKFDSLQDFNKDNIKEYWGELPGKICVTKGKLIIPGISFGNIFIGMQPPRAWDENAEKLYHDPIMPPTHQYIAYYQWIRDVFRADAVIHLGTHGSLEWLPGKNTALSAGCYPDLVLDSLPNIYPYIIDNPGEGIQAKRRSEAVLIGHAAPTMVRSELYDKLELLDSTIREFLNQKSAMPGSDHSTLLDSVRDLLKESSMCDELGIDPENDDLELEIPNIMDHLEEIKDTLIPDGMHIFGDVPGKEETENIVISCLRVKGPCCESLREQVAAVLNLNDSGDDLDVLDGKCEELVRTLSDRGYDVSAVDGTVREILGLDCPEVSEILRYVCSTLVPNIRKTDDEMNSLVAALNGNYVIPGPPGAVSRGDMQALPTGRNIYGIDPETIPTPTSWNNGVRMADAMIDRYVSENGCYPHSIGFIIWATDTMKTGGDDVAYILWLMGVRPIWRSDGHIKSLEVIGPRELGRPRIDVSVRITGLFRDSFPNLIHLINRAVALVADLDETDDENYLAANLRKEIAEQIENGLDEIEARELSMVRVFGGRYGSYGAGLNHAIENRNWESVEDLSKMYVTWGGCGFKNDGTEIRMEETFIKKLSSVDIGIKNMPDRQMDVFTGDDVYAYLGGLAALAKANSGKDLQLYVGDGSNPSKPVVRTAVEECGHVFRSKLLNDKYIAGLRRHGFHGVTELARTSEYMIGWDATSNSIEDWMFKEFAEKIVLNDDNREWMNDENPYALMEIINNLTEAIERGLWDADEDMLERLKDAFLEVEERLEEVNDR